MKKLVVALIASILAVGLLADMVYGAQSAGSSKGPWQDILKEKLGSSFLRLVYLISVVLNMILLLALLIIYLHSFRKTKSYFTLGLSFFIGVLLMQRILFLFFPLIPQLFETLALAILLVLSLE